MSLHPGGGMSRVVEASTNKLKLYYNSVSMT